LLKILNYIPVPELSGQAFTVDKDFSKVRSERA
jgi:hypothetical protein